MSSFVLRLRPVRMLCLLVFVLAIAGCGEVDWFPAFKRLPTTPDAFSFPNKNGTDLSADVTSDPITVSGLTADTSPISVTGSTGSNSRYSINGATATSTAGTVKNGDKVTVVHTSSSAMGAVTISTLQIGNVSATFSSTTKTVTLSPFASAGTVGTQLQLFATMESLGGAHVFNITDSNNTATYLLADVNGVFTTVPFNTKQTLTLTQQMRLYVRKDATSTTSITIDDVDYKVTPPS